MKERIICVDWGYYIHTAIYAKSSISSAWLCCNMLLSDLKNIGASLNDIIYVCVDNHTATNWRKTISPHYKANRAELRLKSGIDFETEYSNMNRLREQLDESTPFYFISLRSDFNNQTVALEADDIISVVCRYYSEHEIVIISRDSDLQQLYHFPNVKIYNPYMKRYINVTNPLEILSKKIIGKEVSDNLKEVVNTEVDYELRKMAVSLIELPEQIEETIKIYLDTIQNKCYNIASFPYRNMLHKLETILNNDYSEEDIITYEKSLSIIEKKEQRKKKQKQKRKQLQLKL
jgi:hypothetical protein